jgi:tripartite-type tricarboxylate transporter receptor subunit TctC
LRIEGFTHSNLKTGAPNEREAHQPLAVTTTEPLAALADVPTVAQFVPGYEASGWFGLGAPKATPGAIVERLNRDCQRGTC